MESIVVQQARCDLEHGQLSIKSFGVLIMALTGILGSAMLAFLSSKFTPYHGLLVCAFFSFLSSFTAYFLSDEVERNRWALMSFEMEEFVSGSTYGESNITYERTFSQLFKIKMKIIKHLFTQVTCSRFHIFLLIQGLFLPKFFDLGFIFATKVQKISKYEMGFCFLASSLVFFMVPFLFNKFYSGRELTSTVRVGLLLSVLTSIIGFIQAKRLNLEFEVPDLPLYLFGAFILETL